MSEDQTSSDDYYRRGLDNRRRIMGDEYVDASAEAQTSHEDDFRRFVTEFAWGSVWDRPGLSYRDRGLITVAILATLDRQPELEGHLRAALRNGCTADELAEVLQHLTVYVGVPAAATAFRTARKVLDT